MKIPKGQILWLKRTDAKGNPKWLITSDPARMKYYLYSVNGEKVEKVKISDSPAEFYPEIGLHL